MQVIKANPSGLTQGEILERMGLKGGKTGEMSVSNALTALTKANQVTRRGWALHCRLSPSLGSRSDQGG